LRREDRIEAAHFDPAGRIGRVRLHALLSAQHYRLAHWRTADTALNWRRFFLVTELVGIRVEDPEVFHAVHTLILRLYREGLIQGLRVDHVDGLAEPGAYLRRLRATMLAAAPARAPYVIVEKILGPDETPDPRWPIEGTTGYDFMDDAGALLHAHEARSPLLAFWHACGGSPQDPRQQLRQLRMALLNRQLLAERRSQVRAWMSVAHTEAGVGPWGIGAWRRMLDAWLAGFPVYRSYVEDGGPSPADRRAWTVATQAAAPELSDTESALLQQWTRWLERPPHPAAEALRRLQQLMPPLAAKSLEDTLFYRFGLLLSRNEVGASLQRFALDIETFHRRNLRRAREWPLALLATATHDHKRGEDVRARLAVLTEMPDRWAYFAQCWLDRMPHTPYTRADGYMLLQTLVGSWPSAWADPATPPSPETVRGWLERVAAWQRKALREAGQHTNWTDPDRRYEAAARRWLDVLDPLAGSRPARTALAAFVVPLIGPGMINGLAQTLWRNTAPGIPDLYQGTESWDESLVDPDNRRPVDHQQLDALMAAPPPYRPVPADWRNGRVKQHLIRTALGLRHDQPAVFGPGADYLPVAAHGHRARHVVAYLRCHADQRILVVAPVHCARSLAPYANGAAEEAARFWGNTALPATIGLGPWQDLLSGVRVDVTSEDGLPLGPLLRHWPVALCVPLR
jgi:(1->4)-alpha-D-glucan 1-alpha-D-glucosylmutase